MNDFEIIVHDKERKANFIEIFGSNTVKIESPFPKKIVKPNGEEALAYFLDLKSITEEQRKRLIENINKRFNQPIEFVSHLVDSMGVPILSEHTTIVIHNPQRWID